MKGSDWYELFVPIVLLGLFVLALFGVYRFRGDLIKPPLLALNTDTQVVTSEDSIVISGNTDKDVSKLLINDQKIKPDDAGNFQANIPLAEGDNRIKVVAYNYEINKNTKELVVIKEAKSEAVMGASNLPVATGSIQSIESMAQSGPAENIAIFGLSILITLMFVNIDRIKAKRKHNLALQ